LPLAIFLYFIFFVFEPKNERLFNMNVSLFLGTLVASVTYFILHDGMANILAIEKALPSYSFQKAFWISQNSLLDLLGVLGWLAFWGLYVLICIKLSNAKWRPAVTLEEKIFLFYASAVWLFIAWLGPSIYYILPLFILFLMIFARFKQAWIKPLLALSILSANWMDLAFPYV
jgi:hypothetical protein